MKITSTIYLHLFSLVFIFCLIIGCEKEKMNCEIFSETCNLLTHDWEIDSLIINGVDSMSYFTNHICYCNTYQFTVQTGNQYLIGYECVGAISSTNLGGRWGIVNNNSVYFSFSYGFVNDEMPSLNSPLFSSSHLWDINKLDENYLWLTTTYNDKSYELFFKRK